MESLRGMRTEIEQLCLAGMRTAMQDEEIRAREAAMRQSEERLRREHRREVLEAMHVPVDDDARRRIIRDDLEDTTALVAVRAALALARPTRFLMLTGGKNPGKSVGTGKTTAAAYALVTVGGGLYIESAELATIAGSRRWEDRERMRVAREVDCLVVDELGVEASASARQARDAALFDIVNRRQSRPKITILITNMSDAAITKSLDERVRSRMRASFSMVGCVGNDMRGAR